MSRTQTTGETATEASARTPVTQRFEVTTLPVSDVDRAKAFYVGLSLIHI